MELGLDGKRALVTGSSAGVGRAIALTLAAEGCAVIIHDRDRDAADAVAQEIRAGGGEVSTLVDGVTVADQADQICAAAVASEIDVLVNNAGPFVEHSWDDAKPATWISAFEGDVTYGVRLVRAVIPAMREKGWGGSSRSAAARPPRRWPPWWSTPRPKQRW